MHCVGLPLRHIAYAFGVSVSTAWRWTRDSLRSWRKGRGPEELAAAVAQLFTLAELLESTRPPRPVNTSPPEVSAGDLAVLAAWAAALRLNVTCGGFLPYLGALGITVTHRGTNLSDDLLTMSL